MAAAARVRSGRSPAVRILPRWVIRSSSDIGAVWPASDPGSWKRPVMPLVMHHCRKARVM